MQKKNLLSAFIMLLLSSNLLAQEPIDIAESTLKIPPQGEEAFFYGFAEGDQLIFSFEEVNGKELKELEIIELPSSSKFMDYKTKKITNKIIGITRTGIYKFRFANSNLLAGRICKFKIQRIPAALETRKFNSNVYTRIVNDTSYYASQERYLTKSDTIINELTSQVAKVHSQGNLNGCRTSFNFSLPTNTIAWSYYIGVDQAGQPAYENATKQLLAKSSPSLIKLVGFSPLGAVALSVTSFLPLIQKGEDVDYYIVQGDNVNLFLSKQQFNYIKKGKVINDFTRMEPIEGMLHVCLFNDNAVMPISVLVKITAIQVNQIWDTKPITKMNITNRQEMYLKN